MIYIETNANNEVISTHYLPFDEMLGMRKTKVELEKTGYLVESLPEVTPVSGKDPILKFDPETKKAFFEYRDRPRTVQETIEEVLSENAVLKEQLATQEQQLADTNQLLMEFIEASALI